MTMFSSGTEKVRCCGFAVGDVLRDRRTKTKTAEVVKIVRSPKDETISMFWVNDGGINDCYNPRILGKVWEVANP